MISQLENGLCGISQCWGIFEHNNIVNSIRVDDWQPNERSLLVMTCGVVKTKTRLPRAVPVAVTHREGAATVPGGPRGRKRCVCREIRGEAWWERVPPRLQHHPRREVNVNRGRRRRRSALTLPPFPVASEGHWESIRENLDRVWSRSLSLQIRVL